MFRALVQEDVVVNESRLVISTAMIRHYDREFLGRQRGIGISLLTLELRRTVAGRTTTIVIIRKRSSVCT